MEKKIMIVDDEPALVKIARIVLEMEDFSVIEAYSGEECIIKLNDGAAPDLILLDINLSKMDGYSVLKKIRENTKYRDVKIIFFSNLGLPEDVKKGLDLGADDFITKPFNIFEIVDAVKKVIQKRIF
jgi:DNA-binding response OmpR family regulator